MYVHMSRYLSVGLQVDTLGFAKFWEERKINLPYAVALMGSHSLIDNQVRGGCVLA